MMCRDRSRSKDTICAFPDCLRNVWKDPDGSFSAFCGKQHRNAMISHPVGTNIPVCKNCQVKPVYNGNGQFYNFCGVRCGRDFQKRGGHPAVPPPEPISSPEVGGSLELASTLVSQKSCSLQTCDRPVWVDDSGTESEYCSNQHRSLAVELGAEACLNCKKFPKILVSGKRSDFCSDTCKQSVIDSAPTMLDLDTNDKQFLNVSNQFLDAWKHPSEVPNIFKIWKIYNKKSDNDRFERYRLLIERKTGLANGNTCRRWHGTKRGCTLGDTSNRTSFCCSDDDDDSCCVCPIIQRSFKLEKSGTRYTFGRFGRGIYTSATSSKADSYVQQNCFSIYKAMFLSDVVMGKTAKMKRDNTVLTEPPQGYDSVVGEPGLALNYDESIVYKDDAIRPASLGLKTQVKI
ncbi:hypothetical protein QCA50_007394 [Cerrena zonata]|uniref:PARP catalytic domain-containing protein n=1 Tax=Cerrena zonata TaxID=2478898 RepID=A0AAW0GAX5_9APHY